MTTPSALRSIAHSLLAAVSLSVFSCTQAPIESPQSVPESLSPLPSITPTAAPQASVGTAIETRIEIIQPTPEPTVIASALPDLSVRPSATAPSPLPTPTPTPTPTSPSPTPVPTATPSPTPTPSTSFGNSSGNNSSNASSPTVTVTSVSIRQPASSRFDKGQTLKLYGFENLSTGETQQSLVWTSSQSAIASVDNTGRVSGWRTGQIQITATSATDSSKFMHLNLTVVSPVYTFRGKIVFKRNDDLYLMDGNNASPERLTFSDDDEELWPRFNWSGDKLTFRLRGVEDIGIIDLKGDRQIMRKDVSAENLAPHPYYWYSNNLIYQDRDNSGNEFLGLFMQRPDGSRRLLTHDLGRVGFLAGVTPNGLIYYERNGRIRSYQANDPNSHKSYDIGDAPKMATNSSPSMVVYSNADAYISTLDFNGNIQVLTGPDTYDIFPALSPDEKQIVFSSKRDGGRHDIFMMNVDGTEVVNLTNTEEVDEVLPEWGN